MPPVPELPQKLQQPPTPPVAPPPLVSGPHAVPPAPLPPAGWLQEPQKVEEFSHPPVPLIPVLPPAPVEPLLPEDPLVLVPPWIVQPSITVLVQEMRRTPYELRPAPPEALADVIDKLSRVTLLSEVHVAAVKLFPLLPPLIWVSEPSFNQSAPSLNPPSILTLLRSVSVSL